MSTKTQLLKSALPDKGSVDLIDTKATIRTFTKYLYRWGGYRYFSRSLSKTHQKLTIIKD